MSSLGFDSYMQTPQTGQTQESSIQSLYETDVYAWAQEQAKLLRHQQWSQLDVLNLIEEIESLGKQQRAELRNRLKAFLVVGSCSQIKSHLRFRRMECKNKLLDLQDLFNSDYYAWR